jgi:hypothetical protein
MFERAAVVEHPKRRSHHRVSNLNLTVLVNANLSALLLTHCSVLRQNMDLQEIFPIWLLATCNPPAQ